MLGLRVDVDQREAATVVVVAGELDLGSTPKLRDVAVRRLLAGDRLVVLDLDSGEERGRVEVPSPAQGFLFPAPGFGRDIYYQSLTTIARVEVTSTI